MHIRIIHDGGNSDANFIKNQVNALKLQKEVNDIERCLFQLGFRLIHRRRSAIYVRIQSDLKRAFEIIYLIGLVGDTIRFQWCLLTRMCPPLDRNMWWKLLSFFIWRFGDTIFD